LPQDTSFTAEYFVNNAILLLANRYAQQLGDLGRLKLYLHFDNSNCHTARRIQEQIAIGASVFPSYSPDLAIADFSLFVILRGVFLLHCDGEEIVTVS
jgi:hypothetical protein